MNVQIFSLNDLNSYMINDSLIFVFSSEEKKFKEIIKNIYNSSNNSTIIFTSTGGEIFNENISKNSTIITSLSFEKTKYEAYYSFCEDSFKTGQELIKKFSKKPDLLILFSTSLNTNAQEVLEGIKSVYSDLKIVGGLAGDNGNFEKTFIGLNNKLFNKGVVGVGLFNENLDVEIHSFLGWIPIGISHKITKAEKNIVYEIDNMPAIKFYEQYLGKKLVSKFPKIGVEFPLLIKRKQKFIARAILGTKDDSLILGGNVKEGDIVHLGIGYPKLILKNHLKKFKIKNPEIFLIFSCLARKTFIGDSIKEEIIPFAKTAKSVGFFSYGEIKNYNFLNQTITIAAISENKNKTTKKYLKEISSSDSFIGIINILNNVIKQLKTKEKYLKALEHDLEIKTNLLNRLSILGKIGSFEIDLNKKEISLSYEVKKFLSKHSCKKCKHCLKFLSKEQKKEILKFVKSEKKEASFEINIDNNYYLLSLKKDKNKLYGLLININELRKKDEMLIAQSRLAQMGEMVNMIAHQWRQPINAISASLIRLEIMLESVCEEDDFKYSKEIIDFINKLIQDLSNTIDEFLNFSKPVSKYQKLNLKEVVNDVLKIIQTQLKNHNIEIETKIDNTEFFGYKKEIEHILLNLIANARNILDERKSENKKITIRAYRNENIIIEVEDNGGGIKVTPIEKVFEPYFTTRKDGTGLGLYMSKNIALKKLNGDLIVENTKDGAKFTLIIGDKNNGS